MRISANGMKGACLPVIILPVNCNDGYLHASQSVCKGFGVKGQRSRKSPTPSGCGSSAVPDTKTPLFGFHGTYTIGVSISSMPTPNENWLG